MDIKDFYREVDGIYANEDWEAAEELFNTAMEQTVGNPERHAVVQNEMGVCFMKRGMHLEAIDALSNAAAYFASAHGPKSNEVVSIKTNLARVYSAMAEHQKARESLMELCEVLGEDPSPLLYDACVGIGHESRLMSDFETAIKYLERAKEVARAYGQGEPLIACLFDLGAVQFERGYRGEAVNALSEALDLCRQQGILDTEFGQGVQAFYDEMSKSACCGCSSSLAQDPITIENE